MSRRDQPGSDYASGEKLAPTSRANQPESLNSDAKKTRSLHRAKSLKVRWGSARIAESSKCATSA